MKFQLQSFDDWEKMALKFWIFTLHQILLWLYFQNIVRPEVLYSEVEIDCRVIPAQDGVCEMKNTTEYRRVTGTTGEDFFVVKELNRDEVYKSLESLKKTGINSISVSLAHSYTVAEQELEVGKIAEELGNVVGVDKMWRSFDYVNIVSGFSHISLSHKVMPMVRLVSRGFTSCADAYLTPHVKRYVEGFCKGFKNNLQGEFLVIGFFGYDVVPDFNDVLFVCLMFSYHLLLQQGRQ